MIALYIALGILLLLLLPLTARYRFGGEGRLVVRYLGIPVYVYSTQKEKKPKKKPKKRSSKSKSKKEKGSLVKRVTALLKEEGAAGVLTLLQEVIAYADTTMRHLFRVLHFGRCRIHVVFGASEASDVALRYGRLAGPLYSARSLALSLLRIRRLDLTMYPNFLEEKDTVTADIRLHACPLSVLVWLLRALCNGTGILSHFSNTKSEDDKNGKKGQ